MEVCRWHAASRLRHLIAGREAQLLQHSEERTGETTARDRCNKMGWDDIMEMKRDSHLGQVGDNVAVIVAELVTKMDSVTDELLGQYQRETKLLNGIASRDKKITHLKKEGASTKNKIKRLEDENRSLKARLERLGNTKIMRLQRQYWKYRSSVKQLLTIGGRK